MSYLIVTPPELNADRADRGFSHLVLAGAARTLCGRRCQDWPLVADGRPEEASCKVCRASYERRERR